MAETLSTLSFVCYISAAVLFVVGIVLFVVLRIPKTFNDYTGRSARKRIMKIRNTNEQTGNKSYRPSKVNKERGKITDNMPEKTKNRKKQEMPETGLISENKARRYESEATGMLEESTAELNEPELAQPARPPKVKLKPLNEVTLIHTQEVIS